MRAPPFDLDRVSAGGLAIAATGLGVYAWLMWPVAQYGHICGHGAGELHCPACYAALATAFLGLAATATPAMRLRRAQRR
jgi:hypothetical protein